MIKRQETDPALRRTVETGEWFVEVFHEDGLLHIGDYVVVAYADTFWEPGCSR